MANAAQLKRIADCLDADRIARHGSGGRAGESHAPRTRSGPQLAPSYSANGFATSGGYGSPEPIAENFPLKRNAVRGDRDLSNMAHGPVGHHSVWYRGRRALGLASGFSLLWVVIAWSAENKLDAIGWAGLTALIADYYYPWTPKVAKLMTFIL